MRLISAVIVLAVFVATDASSWTYSDLGAWPETCQNGTRQSPINLVKDGSKKTKLQTLIFKDYDNTVVATLENNGHTVEIEIETDEDDVPTLRGGPLKGNYILSGIHFHWNSEHTIDGASYPLEAHFVHYKEDYGSLDAAKLESDGLAVLGVLYEINDDSNDVFDGIVNACDTISTNLDVPVQIENDFKPSDLLPATRNKFFTYEGSLTTPNCLEIVTWIVLEEPVSISSSQVAQLSNVYTATGEPLTTNFRPVQDLNDRTVYYSQRS